MVENDIEDLKTKKKNAEKNWIRLFAWAYIYLFFFVVFLRMINEYWFLVILLLASVVKAIKIIVKYS